MFAFRPEWFGVKVAMCIDHVVSGFRDSNARKNTRKDIALCHPLCKRIPTQADAVCKDWNGQSLYVIGDYVVPPGHRRPSLRSMQQSQRATRGATDIDTYIRPCRANECNDICMDAWVYVYVPNMGLQCRDLGCV